MADDDRPKRAQPQPRGRSEGSGIPEELSEDGWQTPPVGTPMLSDIALRMKRTQKETTATLDVSVSTLDRVEAVRTELHNEIGGLRSHVNALAIKTATFGAKLDSIGTAIQDDQAERRLERQAERHLRMKTQSAEIDLGRERELAQLAIGKTRAITEIRADSAVRSFRLKSLYRVLGVACVAATTFLGAYAAGRC